MNIVIPLAGKDPRFTKSPKALQEIKGNPLICSTIDQHHFNSSDKVIVITLAEHERDFGIGEKLQGFLNHTVVVRTISTTTRGAPCTILNAARDLIDNDEDLIIELGDVVRNLDHFYGDIATHRKKKKFSGIIPIEHRTFEDRPWGYVTLKHDDSVQWLHEKSMTLPSVVGSCFATMGLYYFARGKDFVWATEQMISKESFLYKDTFFIGPTYNELIERGDQVLTSWNSIKAILSTPEDVEKYRNLSQ